MVMSGQGDAIGEAVNILEAHGDEAFAEFMEETERLRIEQEAREHATTVPLEDKDKKP